MSKHLDNLDSLIADAEAAGELVSLDAHQAEALRRAAARRKEARRARNDGR